MRNKKHIKTSKFCWSLDWCPSPFLTTFLSSISVHLNVLVIFCSPYYLLLFSVCWPKYPTPKHLSTLKLPEYLFRALQYDNSRERWTKGHLKCWVFFEWPLRFKICFFLTTYKIASRKVLSIKVLLDYCRSWTSVKCLQIAFMFFVNVFFITYLSANFYSSY